MEWLDLDEKRELTGSAEGSCRDSRDAEKRNETAFDGTRSVLSKAGATFHHCGIYGSIAW